MWSVCFEELSPSPKRTAAFPDLSTLRRPLEQGRGEGGKGIIFNKLYFYHCFRNSRPGVARGWSTNSFVIDLLTNS